MRIVWVSPFVPSPDGTGGCLHEFVLIQGLAERHELHVVTCGPPDESAGALEALGVEVTRVAYDRRRSADTPWRKARALASSEGTLSMWASADRVPTTRAAVRRVVEQTAPDLVQITQGVLAPVAEGLSVPTALLSFDALGRAVSTRSSAESRRRSRVRTLVETRKVMAFERRWYREVDAVASVSSVDAGWLESLLGSEVAVLENPIPDDFFDEPQVVPVPGRVTFVGGFGHRPNLDAIGWMMREIWPAVLRDAPDAHLHVAGRASGDAELIASVAAIVGDRAVIQPDVDDIRPVYAEAEVVLSPIRHGAGLRNKVIHAMACGAPVVATSTAMEGVPSAAAAQAFVVDDAVGLAAATVQVLADQPAWRARAAVAREEVRNLSATAAVRRHEQWWADTVSDGD